MNVFDAAIGRRATHVASAASAPTASSAFRLRSAVPRDGNRRHGACADRHPPACDRDRRSGRPTRRQGRLQPVARRPEPHRLEIGGMLGGRRRPTSPIAAQAGDALPVRFAARRPASVRRRDRPAPWRTAWAAAEPHDARHPHRHRCRHLGHQGPSPSRSRRRAARHRGAPEQLSHAARRRRSSRTWRAPGRDTVADAAPARRAASPDLAGRAAALARDRPGRRHLADRRGRRAGRRRPGSGSTARAAGSSRTCDASRLRRRITSAPARGLNACKQSVQLAWLKRHRPEMLDRAATAHHCKDWLYFNLTGERATDRPRAIFTFGDFRTRRYVPRDPRRHGHRRAPAPAA